jgi:hypothetical protein
MSKRIVAPSGDHAGSAAFGPSTRRRAPTPSALVIQIAPPAANAISLPSGDHVGMSAAVKLFVIACVPDPSAFITQMRCEPSRSLSKAIFVPSGEYAASESYERSNVSCVSWPPSGSTA